MNYILKAITDHPEAFEMNLAEEISTDELLQIIYSAKKLGTSIQQNSMTITKLYFGWLVLVKLGLRGVAIPLGDDLLKSYNWNNHYQFAADICNILMKHNFMFDNLIEAEKYERMFKEYRDIYNLEAEMETLYCKIIYKNDHGIHIDKTSINMDLEEIESRLKFDSCKYHYYYYQCQCILNEGEDFEKWCLIALSYFKNLYFKHEIYYNIFIKKLYTYYLSIDNYLKVYLEIPKYFNETKQGSKSWFRFQFIYISALINLVKVEDAFKEMTLCQSLKTYKNLSEAHQEEWQYLADTIKSKSQTKITIKKLK